MKVVAPSVGESITEVSILKWHKKTGDTVRAGDVLLEIESDKASVEIVAEVSGVLTTLQPESARVPVGAPIGEIAEGVVAAATTPAPVQTHEPPQAGPAARKIATERSIDLTTMTGSGKDGRVTPSDFDQVKQQETPKSPTSSRTPMSGIRLKIAERLLMAQQTAAILTTFNEIDMSHVMQVRSAHKESFKAKNGVALSFMSFFSRACVLALKQIPAVNSFIDGRDIVSNKNVDLGIAVGTDRGLVVPVIRHADTMSFVELEKAIAGMAQKARDKKLSIRDMSGGTFTISNGGVYGSLLSTPILNPPQSGILGMHTIQERPVARNGEVVIRPMMYIALSYDHRMIDGKEAVTFLILVKDYLEKLEGIENEL